MKFDHTIFNPPFGSQRVSDKLSGNVIWDDFVLSAIGDWGSNRSAIIIPSTWRKPESNSSNISVYKQLLNSGLSYVRMFTLARGKELFGAGARFDWTYANGLVDSTNIRVSDANGNEHVLKTCEWPFIPSSEFELIAKLLDTERDSFRVCYGSAHHAVRDHVVNSKSDRYCYPVVHSTTISGPRILWTDRNDVGFFGIPKVIFGETGVNDPIIDMDGRYGTTQNAIALPVSDKKEAELVVSALRSDTFSRVLEACTWSTYRIEYRIFEWFRDDWYDVVLGE